MKKIFPIKEAVTFEGYLDITWHEYGSTERRPLTVDLDNESLLVRTILEIRKAFMEQEFKKELRDGRVYHILPISVNIMLNKRP